ncbi:hypothetical protein [Winogradskyella haliclonae]|uniref:Protocatechuate 3,4-dioxygenase beta subunit n=1 Tax=Winogradskyella haliclonae TaxID=2048558 RepID=A0ABQ2BYY0_9FLAO|nr:hypothetical protein [Winogradskyella haliclonae]GGI57476.1 hypothetical protein GCM10011444_17850 [Winogradskyella haliclonae]
MKLTIFSLVFAITLSTAQTSNSSFIAIDIVEGLTNNTDTIPDYSIKSKQFKISGTIYLEDGATPAKNHVLTINQADEDGNFVVEKINGQKKVKHSATVKTNADGKYTFYTFVPGGDRLYNQLQEIHIKVQVPDGTEYALPTLFFDEDPMLSKRCRKKMAKRGETDRILKLQKVDNKLVAKRDMIISGSLKRIN